MVIELLIKYCINEIILVNSVYLSNYSLEAVVMGVTLLLIFVVEYAYFIPFNKNALFYLFLCPSELRFFFQSLVKGFPVTAYTGGLLRCPSHGLLLPSSSATGNSAAMLLRLNTLSAFPLPIPRPLWDRKSRTFSFSSKCFPCKNSSL